MGSRLLRHGAQVVYSKNALITVTILNAYKMHSKETSARGGCCVPLEGENEDRVEVCSIHCCDTNYISSFGQNFCCIMCLA